MRGHHDYETASEIDLKKVGVHKYAEHPSSRVWLFSWRLGDGTIFRWRPGDPDPKILLDHIQNGGTMVAHNAMFERTIYAMARIKYGLSHWPVLRAEQQDCTVARAFALNLPGDLERLSKVLSSPFQKDMEGAALMQKMMKPNRDGTWNDTPKNIERLGLYCDRDVLAESWIDNALPTLTADEQELWVLDQEINDRGIPLDVEAIIRAVDVVAYAKREANRKMAELTGGAVKKCTEVAKILAWINSQGVQCAAFRKGDHDDIKLMAGFAGNKLVRKVVELRGESSKTSAAKYDKWLLCVCGDNMARGQYQYHGAAQTGRFAGRLGQFQNIVRVDWDRERTQIEYVINLLHSSLTTKQVYDMLDLAFGKPLEWLSKSLRGMIWADAR